MRTTTLRREGDRLSEQDLAAWQEAVAAVDAVAQATDTESASKEPLEALRLLVRTHPVAVVNSLLPED